MAPPDWRTFGAHIPAHYREIAPNNAHASCEFTRSRHLKMPSPKLRLGKCKAKAWCLLVQGVPTRTCSGRLPLLTRLCRANRLGSLCRKALLRSNVCHPLTTLRSPLGFLCSQPSTCRPKSRAEATPGWATAASGTVWWCWRRRRRPRRWRNEKMTFRVRRRRTHYDDAGSSTGATRGAHHIRRSPGCDTAP